MQGAAFESVAEFRTRGFLFDMNIFFQRLLSRFLSENLTSRQIKDEHAIGNVFAYSVNPKGRTAPKPRPDYALFHNNRLCGFLDAKYRDVWEKGLPPDWLYQLAIYALASPSQVSVLLYATMTDNARDEQIEIDQPINWSSEGPACVIVRPVPLPKLAELVHPNRGARLSTERRRFADALVLLETDMSTLVARNHVVQAA
jgi:5-methylcytosine-specific restriction enzyme subunit McrC